MSRSLYISGNALQQLGAEAYRVAYSIGGALKYEQIAQFEAAVRNHNHYEVSTMANAKHAGVPGSWWLPTGTHTPASGISMAGGSICGGYRMAAKQSKSSKVERRLSGRAK